MTLQYTPGQYPVEESREVISELPCLLQALFYTGNLKFIGFTY